jgi:L-lactate dehydrogenase (cytochrome)
VPVITCVEDLRVLARQRVPRMFYDYADSGSWTEGTYRANESDLQKIKLRQRGAVNMEVRKWPCAHTELRRSARDLT